MKKILYIIIVFCLSILACDGMNDAYNVKNEPADSGFNMKYVPGGAFPTGTGSHTSIIDGGGNVVTVSTPFLLAETEVTYKLWFTVRTWAVSNGYTFANPGREGSEGEPGAAATPDMMQPVTAVSWRDSIIWCNALTEYCNAFNGSEPDLDCAYYLADQVTPIRSADDSETVTDTIEGSQDMPHVKTAARGYRLPGSMEWECAARYKNGTIWTPGNSASGAVTFYNDTTVSADINKGKKANDQVAVYKSYWDGSLWIDTGVTGTNPVMSKNPNVLGLYDMSGNVLEWCFDKAGSGRVVRGGSYYTDAGFLRVGNVNTIAPYHRNISLGFRFARNL